MLFYTIILTNSCLVDIVFVKITLHHIYTMKTVLSVVLGVLICAAISEGTPVGSSEMPDVVGDFN